MPARRFDSRLEEGLDRLVSGERADLAAGINWSMAELEELLSAGAWLRGLPSEAPSREARLTARQDFLSRGEFKHRSWVDEQARSREIGVVTSLMRRTLDRRLDEAISRVQAGEDPGRATGINWVMAEVEDLLRPAVLLSSLHRAEPGQDGRAQARDVFVSAAAARRSSWEAKHFRPGIGDRAYGVVGRSLTRRIEGALSLLVAGKAWQSRGTSPADVEMNDLVAAAAPLTGLPHESADRASRTRVRNIFMAEAAHRRVAWVHHHELPLTTTRSRRAARPRPHGVRGTALLTMGAILAVVLGAGLAGATGVSEPDNPLYGLKRVSESVLLRLAGDPVSHADLEVKLAGQRMREAEAMAIKDEPQQAVDATRAHFDALRAAASDLGSHPVHDKAWQKTRDRLKDEEGKPVTPVEQALTRAKHEDAAAVVKQEAEKFQNDRKILDKELGTPQPSPSVSAVPGQP